MGGDAAEDDRGKRQNGGHTKGRNACKACAYGAASGQNTADAHQNCPEEVATGLRRAFKALPLEPACHQRSDQCTDQHTAHKTGSKAAGHGA